MRNSKEKQTTVEEEGFKKSIVQRVEFTKKKSNYRKGDYRNNTDTVSQRSMSIAVEKPLLPKSFSSF